MLVVALLTSREGLTVPLVVVGAVAVVVDADIVVEIGLAFAVGCVADVELVLLGFADVPSFWRLLLVGLLFILTLFILLMLVLLILLECIE